MTKRTVLAPPQPIDFTPLIRGLSYLDDALRRGVVLSVVDENLVVDDEVVAQALLRLNALMAETSKQMDMLARSYARICSPRLQ